MKHKLLSAAIVGAMLSCPGIAREFTATPKRIEPINKGRRGEKDLEKLRRAQEKRGRRAVKRRG